MVISQDVPLYRFDLNKKLDETSLIDPDVIEIAVNWLHHIELIGKQCNKWIQYTYTRTFLECMVVIQNLWS